MEPGQREEQLAVAERLPTPVELFLSRFVLSRNVTLFSHATTFGAARYVGAETGAKRCHLVVRWCLLVEMPEVSGSSTLHATLRTFRPLLM